MSEPARGRQPIRTVVREGIGAVLAHHICVPGPLVPITSSDPFHATAMARAVDGEAVKGSNGLWYIKMLDGIGPKVAQDQVGAGDSLPFPEPVQEPATPPAPPARALSVWVPGRLQNPKNWHAWGVWKHRRYVRTWRERTAQYLLQELCTFPHRQWPWPIEAWKTITFTASVFREWDDDGLILGLVPVRDALRDMHVIVDDAPRHGHEFLYRQCLTRKTEEGGILLSIELRKGHGDGRSSTCDRRPDAADGSGSVPRS